MRTKTGTDETLLERLASHRAIGGIPPHEAGWLVAHGEIHRYRAGEHATRKGDPVDEMYIVLEGRTAIHVDRGAGPRKVMEWNAGDVTGVLPYSRMTHSPGESIMEVDGEFLAIHRRDFPEMIVRCPMLTATCVHIMLDRARVFNSSELQDEKMMSLGRLSAGLAHELNNPASAAARGARLLQEALATAERASRELGALRLDDGQLAAIDAVRDACLAGAVPGVRSPLERADREDAISDWLSAHGVQTACAPTLADTAVTMEELDALAAVTPGRALDTALRWIAAGCTVRSLGSDVERAAARIDNLVGAVKRFTYMDRPMIPEPTAIEQGLADTVTILGAKARGKSASVTLDIEPGLAKVRAFGGDVNQAWTNLIDNALDAIGEGGRVTVSARSDGDWVAVGIADDGPGIPVELWPRVFDPFFTTKPVGQGTGLGLDIARRIVRAAGGDIAFDSRPGRTEFTVRLRVAD